MNVLHVIPAIAPRYGGHSEAVISLAKGQKEKGVHVVIATTDADGTGRLSVPINGLTEQFCVPVRFFRGSSVKRSSIRIPWRAGYMLT